MEMRIARITESICVERVDDIAGFVYKSMNRNKSFELCSKEQARMKCEQLRGFVKSGNAISFLALAGDSAVGFIWAYPAPDRWDENRVYVSILYVDEPYRRQSLGRRLIESVEAEARRRGYGKIWLHTQGGGCKC